jgi:hypothetical protein
MKILRVLCALAAALAAGCAQVEVARVAGEHPADSSASEAPVGPMSGTLTIVDPVAVEESHAGHGDHGGHAGHATSPATEPAVFFCPHHPEVVAAQPGNCPKCRMTLQKKPPIGTAPATKGKTHEH